MANQNQISQHCYDMTENNEAHIAFIHVLVSCTDVCSMTLQLSINLLHLQPAGQIKR